MISDSGLAQICADSYHPGATVQVNDVLAANIVRHDGETIIAFRGTANLHGWLRDLDVMPKSHELLGYCHHGFLIGATALMQHLDALIDSDDPVTLTGHSLGGALATVYGALRIAGNERVGKLVTFGAPKAGYERLSQVWRALAPGDIRLYRNGNDPVPEVPLTLKVFPYMHVAELRQIGVPDLAEPWNCHSILLYKSLVE